ncbi:formimidoylglutamase [Virgibacillus salexigens]|uniref:formimidoylglutamase n=1 Tax=Virgibacillus massiliensis TaxID=1462526 RepID=UPI00301C2FA0
MIFIYQPVDKQIWTGRVDDYNNPRSYRFHQIVEIKNNSELIEQKQLTFGFIGFECDEGVKRNKGRQGAKKAPNEIRKSLAKLPSHINSSKIIDLGNVQCMDERMEEAQEELGTYIHSLFKHRCTPIILGGGHETLYGHYLGVRKSVSREATIGIINIDAHFDLRNEAAPSSGTMFKQILEQDKRAGYLCLGIQRLGNTQALFDEADNYSCQYVMEEDVADLTSTFQQIDWFSEQYDYLMLTLCTDSLQESAAPGVSAPSPFGLEPKTVRAILQYISNKQQFVSFDISEVNPELDTSDSTVRLAAYLVAEVMQGIHRKSLKGIN